MKLSFRTAVPLFAAVLAAFLCSRYCFQLILIRGESMIPSYHPMELAILSRRTTDYRAGDVIAFHCEELHASLVKRIAAVPGDTAVISEGTLYVNGEISPVYSEKGAFTDAGLLSEPAFLGEQQYLVIGDNLEKSRDSRDEAVGLVSESAIFGKLIGKK